MSAMRAIFLAHGDAQRCALLCSALCRDPATRAKPQSHEDCTPDGGRRSKDQRLRCHLRPQSSGVMRRLACSTSALKDGH
eukprot:scaffold14887_cov123-Isochrysis_galbana.AAC.4